MGCYIDRYTGLLRLWLSSSIYFCKKKDKNEHDLLMDVHLQIVYLFCVL